jgi:hypothetical protein
MPITIKLIKNQDGVVTSFVVEDKYEIRPDGKVYSPKFINKELSDYPSDLLNKDIKSLMYALWKS